MKLISKIASLSVGLALAVGVGVALGSKEAKVVKADATISGGTAVTINSKDGYKFGTSKVAGSASITVDSGSNTLKFKAIGWKNETVSLSISATDVTFDPSSIDIDSNDSISGSGSTFNDIPETEYTISFDAVSASTSVTVAASSGRRFILWDVSCSSESAGDPMGIRNNSYASGPFEVTYGDTSEFKYAVAYDVNSDQSLKEGVSWDVSDPSIIDYTVDGWTWLAYKPKAVGTTTITANCDGYKTASTTITVVPGDLESLAISGSMSKTSYYVGESWSPAGFSVSATYDSGYVGDVTSEVDWSYNPAAPASSVKAVVATASFGGKSVSSGSQEVTVSRTNPIQVLYTQSSGASVDVYGYYVGFLDGTGPVIMDGAYGIVIYNKSADVSGYTEKETILHVTGSISIYKGLYEIGSASMSIAFGTFDAPDTPVVYATNGSETADYASRLTTVTGTPTLTSGSFDDAAGTNDIKMNFAVGTKTVQVFYKKAAQTADADAFAAIKAAVADSEEITIKGFTGWYDGFQVQMNGYVKPAESYTAEQFAQDLLDQTDAVCEGWKKGDDNHDAIEAIWSDLASNDKYPSLPAAQKTILAEAERDEEGTVVEQAMARYDYLTGKYNLSNFINGRTPVSFASNAYANLTLEGNTTIFIVVIIAAVSTLAFTMLLVFKKKKHN